MTDGAFVDIVRMIPSLKDSAVAHAHAHAHAMTHVDNDDADRCYAAKCILSANIYALDMWTSTMPFVASWLHERHALTFAFATPSSYTSGTVHFLMTHPVSADAVRRDASLYLIVAACGDDDENEYGRCAVTRRLVEEFGADPHAHDNAPFKAAVTCGAVRQLHVLMELRHAHVSVTDLLCSACEHGSLDSVVSLLTEYGADPNGKFGMPLAAAAKNGYASVVDVLCAVGATWNSGFRPLTCACAGGHLDCVLSLLRWNVDVRMRNDEALRASAQAGHAQIVALLLAFGAGAGASALKGAPYRLAVANGHDAVVGLLEAHSAASSSASASATATATAFSG